MSAYEEAARRGAELLDRNAEGWRERVELGRLNLANSCGCVLGQTFGNFDDGLEALGLDYGEAVKYGFDVANDDSLFNRRSVSARYGWLARAWFKVLRNGN
jgi:hypothetical protein